MRRKQFVRAALLTTTTLGVQTMRPTKTAAARAVQHAASDAGRPAGGAGGILDEASIRDLQAALRGEVLLPGGDGYDAARAVWNAAVDRHPALAVRAAGAADVAAAVAFARERDLPLSVRGGGHGVAGHAVADGGLLLDLARLTGVRVDPGRRTARAEPGLTWGQFDRETHAFGLATTGSVVSAVGLAGLTLGGGLGWLLRKHGMTIDNLLAADVVTADGQLLTASAEEHPDLFWALRGGGGNFGVVNSFEYRLHPLTQVLGGLLVHPREQAREALRFFRDLVPTVSEDLGVRAALLTTPEGQPAFAFALCYSGPPEGAAAAVGPLRAFGPPAADLVRALPYPELQRLLDAAAPPGLRHYWRSGLFEELTDDVIDLIVGHAGGAPSPRSSLLLDYYGGAASRVGAGDTAYPHREPLFGLVINAAWAGPDETAANVAWARAAGEAVRAVGGRRLYSNQMTADEQGRIRDAYGANYERLARLKARYDPSNLFRLNPNIPSTPHGAA
jgi:FAD/FMN-containing dehydrogenase